MARKLIDILPPRGAAFGRKPVAPPPLRPRRSPSFRMVKVIGAFFFVCLLAVATFYGFGIASFKRTAEQSLSHIAEKFREAEAALTNLEPRRAKTSFEEIVRSVQGLAKRADAAGLVDLAEFWGEFSAKVKTFPETFKSFVAFSEEAALAAGDLDALKNNAFAWITKGEGNSLIERLSRLEERISRIITLGADLKNGTKNLNVPFTDRYLPFITKLYAQETLLRTLIVWLKAPEDRHLLVLFQNPSEIRPGGGFIGSYADLTIREGSLTSLAVRDIYDPDGQLEERIIPPKPLQAITPRWGARDANWFFDFPTSARKVIELLEASKIYREQLMTFDGAIAMNVHVIQSLLDVTGQIELPEYGLTVGSDNFLTEIQREVESGSDKTKGEPKRILKVLTPLLFERLGDLADEEKRALITNLQNHFKGKDIMAYFKDLVLQSYVKGLGVAGDVAELPRDFIGDYLAVANANIAGGKSDAFITQRITLQSKIGSEGEILNFLAVERSHTGENARDPWHRAPNKNYLKVFTPRGSRLTYANGSSERIIAPPLDYLAAAYLVDPDVKTMEETAEAVRNYSIERTEEFGKTAFAGWFTVPPGTARKLELQYENPVTLALGKREIPYTFVFEKQSGVRTAVEWFVEAPPGYEWKESGVSTFTYEHDDPPARLEVRITLAPIP